MGTCLPRGNCMVRIFCNVSQRRSLKKEFRMHSYAFVMLYLKDGPLRRSSECIGLFLCQMYALILYFAGNIKCQGGEGRGE